MTATLEKAFRSLQDLPTDLRNELGESLISDASKWRALQGAINQGLDDLARGEIIEIDNVDDFVARLKRKH